MESILIRIAASVCGFFLFGLAAVHGPWGAGPIQARLAAAAQERLAEAGLAWAHAEADGQTIVLSGRAPTEAQRRAAVEISKKAIGPGGRAIGGVTGVRPSFLSAPPLSPIVTPLADYRFAATLAEGRLGLSGMVPSETARDALAATAEGDVRLDDRTAIYALGDGENWLSTATAALDALLMLESGEVRQQGATFTLTGRAPDAAVADAAESLAAGAAGTFAFTVNIIRPAPKPSASELADACQSAINRATNGRRLTFREESAWLSDADRAFLDSFSGEISACGGQTIAIEGHTDSVGSANDNMALSRRRAEAVRTYLQSIESEAAYVVKAYGETRPIASNRTESGQRSNRRIEFAVAAVETESD